MALQANTFKDPDKRPMVDSGATHGMTNDRALLKDIESVSVNLRGVMAMGRISERGTLIGVKGVAFKHTLLFEKAPRTVLAVRQIIDVYPGEVTMGKNLKQKAPDGKITVLGPRTSEGWYRLEAVSTDTS